MVIFVNKKSTRWFLKFCKEGSIEKIEKQIKEKKVKLFHSRPTPGHIEQVNGC